MSLLPPPPTDQWRLLFDIILMSLLFLLLLLTLLLIFFKNKNVPVSQCIEVDPREPHSITITFVPSASAGGVGGVITNDTITRNNTSNNVEATNVATDATEMTMTQTPRNASVISSHDSQTAPIA